MQARRRVLVRPLLTLSTALVVAACSSSRGGSAPGAAGAAPVGGAAARSAPAPLAIPPELSGFRSTSRRNFDDPRAGTVIRYSGPENLSLDLYLYPGPDLAAQCDIPCATRVIDRETADFPPSLDEMVRQGTVEKYSVVRAIVLPKQPETKWALARHVHVVLTRARQQAQRSDFYLFYIPNYRVKVRVTYDETAERTAAIDAFVREIVPALLTPRSDASP